MPFLIFASERFRTSDPFQRFFTSQGRKAFTASRFLTENTENSRAGFDIAALFSFFLFFSPRPLRKQQEESRHSFPGRRNRSGEHFSLLFSSTIRQKKQRQTKRGQRQTRRKAERKSQTQKPKTAEDQNSSSGCLQTGAIPVTSRQGREQFFIQCCTPVTLTARCSQRFSPCEPPRI